MLLHGVLALIFEAVYAVTAQFLTSCCHNGGTLRLRCYMCDWFRHEMRFSNWKYTKTCLRTELRSGSC